MKPQALPLRSHRFGTHVGSAALGLDAQSGPKAARGWAAVFNYSDL